MECEQVVALQLRSKAGVEEALPEPQDEMDYVLVLNRLLPPSVRVLGWCGSFPGPCMSCLSISPCSSCLLRMIC